MTNLARWNYYLKDAQSPQNWVDLVWYACVCAALQRRVWYNPLRHMPLFPNLYIVLIGPPATGKNLVLSPARKLLSHWTANPADQNTLPVKGVARRLKIPMGPDTVTAERLYDKFVEATEMVSYEENGQRRAYAHASVAFVLEELNALFRRNEDKVYKFLLKTYDCDNPEYETRTQSKSYIHNSCANLLCGGTYSILKDAAKFGLFDDGFTSRTIFAFEHEPRHRRAHQSTFEEMSGEVDPMKDAVWTELLDWIKKLTTVFGQVRYTREVFDKIEHWQETEVVPKLATASYKMQLYFGRRPVALKKLAMGIHYSDNLTPEISLEAFEQAHELLRRIETNMAAGFGVAGRNELHGISREILKYIKQTGGAGPAELLSEFGHDITAEELESIMKSLCISGDVRLAVSNKYTA